MERLQMKNEIKKKELEIIKNNNPKYEYIYNTLNNSESDSEFRECYTEYALFIGLFV